MKAFGPEQNGWSVYTQDFSLSVIYIDICISISLSLFHILFRSNIPAASEPLFLSIFLHLFSVLSLSLSLSTLHNFDCLLLSLSFHLSFLFNFSLSSDLPSSSLPFSLRLSLSTFSLLHTAASSLFFAPAYYFITVLSLISLISTRRRLSLNHLSLLFSLSFSHNPGSRFSIILTPETAAIFPRRSTWPRRFLPLSCEDL